MNTTKLLAYAFHSRLKVIERYKHEVEEIQLAALRKNLFFSRDSEYGKRYDFSAINTYEQYKENVPLANYETIKHDIERMMRGEKNILWSSDVRWFAKSSGTTNDKSKFIPVSNEALQDCHFQGGKDCIALYLENNSDSRFFSGKGLVLGGSHAPASVNSDIHTGDLSAILIHNAPALIDLVRTPRKEVLLMSDWEKKLRAIVEATSCENVTSLSGVPSWFLVFIKSVILHEGKQNLSEIWPNLEVFFHGGISFDPYRDQYRELIPSEKMHFMETYNASEGFFGIQSNLLDPSMLLMIDLGIFFEFIPIEDIDSDNPRVYPLWEVSTGVNYAIVISTNSGLWRYMIGDTVMLTSANPYKFKITGRTKLFINAFGEELMVANAEKAIAITSLKTGAVVKDYTAAPTFMSCNSKGHHSWIVEFEKEPDSIDVFAGILDDALQTLNSDYEAKRYKDIFLSRLELTKARPNLFHDWLKLNNKLGGQHKIPRLSNSREYYEALMKMNNMPATV